MNNRRSRRQVGERHLRLVKSDGVFRDIAERAAAVERKRLRALSGSAPTVTLCSGVMQLQRTPSGAVINPKYWIKLTCCQALGHVGYCVDGTGIGFRAEQVVWWNKYTDTDIWDLVMTMSEPGLVIEEEEL